MEQLPHGECELINDVGMVGGIPGACVLDMRGLVTRASAEADLAHRQDARFADLLASEARPFAVRQAWWGDTPREAAAWLSSRYSARSELQYPAGAVGWSSDYSQPLAPELVASRWRALYAQHPDHPWIAWRAAIAAAKAGDLASARAIAGGASERWPQVDMVAAHPSRWSFAAGDVPLEWKAGAGFVLPHGGTLTTRPVDCTREEVVVEGSSGPTVEVEGRAGWVPVLLGHEAVRLELDGCDERERDARFRVRHAGAGISTPLIVRVEPARTPTLPP